MTGKGEILLTYADVLALREEDKRVTEQLQLLSQRRLDIKRDLEAAEVWAAKIGRAPPSGNGHDSKSRDTGDTEERETAPVALIANLRKTGDSLNVQGIKKRIIDLGFGDKIAAQPNYHYSLAYRLTKAGKLLRRGTKYQAAPIGSPEGETEAGGASVRH